MKKILYILLIIIMCITVTGCFEKTVEGNKSFGEYTGIYKLKNFELRVAQYKNDIAIIIKHDGKPFGSTKEEMKGNKLKSINCEFEFKKNAVIVNTNQKDIPKGKYKRLGSYTTKEIYKDYIGDISFIDTKYNGIYENNGKMIYTVQTGKDIVRLANYNEDSSLNVVVQNNGNDIFKSNFFEDYYELKYGIEKLEANFKSEKKKLEEQSGMYNKTKEMKATDIIKVFVFESYIKK